MFGVILSGASLPETMAPDKFQRGADGVLRLRADHLLCDGDFTKEVSPSWVRTIDIADKLGGLWLNQRTSKPAKPIVPNVAAD